MIQLLKGQDYSADCIGTRGAGDGDTVKINLLLSIFHSFSLYFFSISLMFAGIFYFYFGLLPV